MAGDAVDDEGMEDVVTTKYVSVVVKVWVVLSPMDVDSRARHDDSGQQLCPGTRWCRAARGRARSVQAAGVAVAGGPGCAGRSCGGRTARSRRIRRRHRPRVVYRI